jgi:hypothetical protein
MKMEKNTILNAIQEIEQLRRSNQLLAAQVRVLDILAAIVLPQREQGMSPDIVWQLRRELEVEDAKRD